MIGVYGDNCIDRYVRPLPTEFIGGNAVNVAVHLARLGAQVGYFGVLGNDFEGRTIRRVLSACGVCCSNLEIREGPTAVTWIEVRDGERIVLDDDVGVQCPLFLSEQSRQVLAACSHVHCTAFTSWHIDWSAACPRIVDEIQYLAARGKFVSVDFSELTQPGLARILGPNLSLAFVSRGSSCTTSELEQTFRFFHDCGIPRVVVTLGARGAAYRGPDVQMEAPAAPIKPVDTLGAGDAFIAGWLFGAAQGWDTRTTLRQATTEAAQTCLYQGAWPGAFIGKET
ncbi:MAG: PfkB family carbohydrate kinase [Acidobacteriota bacterium]